VSQLSQCRPNCIANCKVGIANCKVRRRLARHYDERGPTIDSPDATKKPAA
jgi:hypothetical protein